MEIEASKAYYALSTVASNAVREPAGMCFAVEDAREQAQAAHCRPLQAGERSFETMRFSVSENS